MEGLYYSSRRDKWAITGIQNRIAVIRVGAKVYFAHYFTHVPLNFYLKWQHHLTGVNITAAPIKVWPSVDVAMTTRHVPHIFTRAQNHSPKREKIRGESNGDDVKMKKRRLIEIIEYGEQLEGQLWVNLIAMNIASNIKALNSTSNLTPE